MPIRAMARHRQARDGERGNVGQEGKMSCQNTVLAGRTACLDVIAIAKHSHFFNLVVIIWNRFLGSFVREFNFATRPEHLG
jgi:hypothetical protein